jgi:hypothetical protein
MPVFQISPSPGLIVPGNIDLTKRPIVRNPNGTVSTVKSVSFGFTVDELSDMGFEIEGFFPIQILHALVPQVLGRRVVSQGGARSHFMTSGQHLGIFNTPAAATAYARHLHRWQADYYRKRLRRI